MSITTWSISVTPFACVAVRSGATPSSCQSTMPPSPSTNSIETPPTGMHPSVTENPAAAQAAAFGGDPDRAEDGR